MIIGIDPGSYKTGAGVLFRGEAHVYLSKPAGTLAWKCGLLYNFVRSVASNYHITYNEECQFVVEEPEYQDSDKGRMFLKQSNFTPLCAAFGAILAGIQSTGFQVITVTPSKWKGQVPKRVTRSRLIKRGVPAEQVDAMSEDESDALALAYWAHDEQIFNQSPSIDTPDASLPPQ